MLLIPQSDVITVAQEYLLLPLLRCDPVSLTIVLPVITCCNVDDVGIKSIKCLKKMLKSYF